MGVGYVIFVNWSLSGVHATEMELLIFVSVYLYKYKLLALCVIIWSKVAKPSIFVLF